MWDRLKHKSARNRFKFFRYPKDRLAVAVNQSQPADDGHGPERDDERRDIAESHAHPISI